MYLRIGMYQYHPSSNAQQAMGDDLRDFGPHVRALLKPFDAADLQRLTGEIRAHLQK